MRKMAFGIAMALLAAGSLPAATRTWSGAGDGTTWADAANWGGTVPAAGDTAAFNATVTFAGDVVLPGNLTVSVASGMTVTLNGVVSGTGNLTKTGAGNLWLVNAANTYDGSTTVSAGSLYYTSLAKIGEASSLGRPTSAANAAITLAGANLYMIDQSNKAYETDRPVSMNSSSYFYVGTLTGTGGQSASSTITLTGPFAGMPRIRGRGTLAIRSHLGSAITGDITRTDAGTTELLNPTNSSTRNVLISDGVVRVADLGKPGPLAAGSSIYMGQNNYSTTSTSTRLRTARCGRPTRTVAACATRRRGPALRSRAPSSSICPNQPSIPGRRLSSISTARATACWRATLADASR